MKAQTLMALAMALVSSLCNAATFAKPFNIDFYQKDTGSYKWNDLTHTKPFGTTIADGTSPNEKDPSFLGHFRFNSTDDVKRTYHWNLEGGPQITCDVVVSGDPGVANLIYHVDSRKFEVQDGEEPDLSVVHVRCRLPPKRGDQHDPDFSFDDPTFNPDDSTYGFAYDSFDADSNITKVDPPPLKDTDLEQVLNVIFQISGQPVTQADLSSGTFSKDFLWDQLPDKSMSAKEVDYESYKSRRARDTYNYLLRMDAHKEPTDIDRLLEERSEYMWFGEVGRMVISRAGGTRDFMWAPSLTVNATKCHFKLNHDPHTAVLYVNMTASDPTVSLQGEKYDTLRGDGDGDPGAASVHCNPADPAGGI